jgi:hypothetical protein
MNPATDDVVLPLDAFVRSVAVKIAVPHSFFLGAGSSVTSGLPSAATCTWEWKREIFLSKNPGLEAQFSEWLPAVKRKIQQWLNAQGSYPEEGSADEYGAYFKRCYPIQEDRRLYFQEKVRQASPHIGYKLLCLLAEAGIVRSVWSTNFDGLPARAAATSRITPIEVGIDCQNRLLRAPNNTELLCVSLHGDYRYDPLKNTPEELQQQEERLKCGLIEHMHDVPLIVVGYSGRDASIMEALTAAYSRKGPGSLYWCGYDAAEMPEPVQQLLTMAREHGRSAYYVPTQGFDDLLMRLALRCLQGDPRAKAESLIASTKGRGTLAKAPFALPELPTASVIKSNAFRLEYPGELFQFSLNDWPERPWRWFKDKTAGKDLVAVPFRRKAYAIGTIDDIKATFSDAISGPIERTPTAEDDVRYEDSALVSLLRSALVCSMAAKADIHTNGKALLWCPEPQETRNEQGYGCALHEAAIVYIRRIGRRHYVVLKPTIVVKGSNGAELPEEVIDQVKLKFLGYQHNDKFNQAMASWRKRLFADQHPVFEYPPNCGSPFRFKVARVPVLAKIAAATSGSALPSKRATDLRSGSLASSCRSLSFFFRIKPARGLCAIPIPSEASQKIDRMILLLRIGSWQLLYR